MTLVLPEGMDAVAPGNLVSREKAGRRQTLDLAGAPRLPELSLRLPRDDTQNRPAGTAALSVLHRAAIGDGMAALDDTSRMIAYFEEKSGLPLPEVSYTQVLVDQNGDQEDAGLSMIERASIERTSADPHTDGMIAHELAHEWWGNLITCADWRELWLNEGFAGFMTAAYKEQRWGRAAHDREIAVARRAWDAARLLEVTNP